MADDTGLDKAKAGSAEVNLIDRLYTGVAENTVFSSAMVPDSQRAPFNSDDIYDKDNTYKIYEEMLLDDQVSVASQLKKDLVLNSGWDIVMEKEGDQAVRDMIEMSLREDVETPLEEQLEEVLSAYDFGFSVSEKIFQRRPDGTLSFKTLKTRHPATWTLHTDDKGKVIKYEQTGRIEAKDLDSNSLIHYINSPKFQNPYGHSDLRKAFQAYIVKRQIVKYYAIFLEKAASPIPVGKFDKNAPASAVDKIFQVLKRFQAKTALVIPKDIEVEFLNSGNNGEAYTKGIAMFNMFIGRALFVPDLVGLQGGPTEGGSFALGTQHMEIYAQHIQKRRNILEWTVNNHIVKPLVISNFGFIDHFPKFKLRPISDQDALKAAEIWLKALNANKYQVSPEELNHFRSIIKFPESEIIEGEEIPGQEPEGGEPANPDDPLNDEENPFDGNDPAEGKGDLPGMREEDEDKMAQFVEEGPFKLPKGDFHKKVDFNAIKSVMDSGVQKVLTASAPVVDMMVEDLLDQIQKKKVLNPGNIGRLDSIKIRNLKQLQLILKKSFKDTFVAGKKLANNEIFKREFAEPIPDDEFLAIIEQETFDAIGKWKFEIDEDTRLEIRAAIKSGRPISSVVSNLGDKVKGNMNVAIERFARTKTTEMVNRGRMAFFEESGVLNGWQYSAVLDGRTTDICRGLHGKKFKKGAAPVPPLHFNCRSVLIPITIFEEFEDDKTVATTVKAKDGKSVKIDKPIDQFIKEKAGESFI